MKKEGGEWEVKVCKWIYYLSVKKNRMEFYAIIIGCVSPPVKQFRCEHVQNIRQVDSKSHFVNSIWNGPSQLLIDG